MIIDKSEIAAKLAKLKSAMPAKNATVGVRGVLIKDGKAIANNYEIGITAALPDHSGDDDPFILPQKAIDMIESLPDGEVEIIAASGNITIIMDGMKTTFPTLDAKDFTEPAAPSNAGEHLKIDSKKLYEMASSILYAAATSEAKPVFTGLLFEAKGGELNVVALDGYRAAWNKTAFEGDFKFIVPRTAMDKLLRLGISGDIEISYNDKNAVFASEDYTVYTRLLSGEFIDYKKTFPAYENQIVVNRKALLEGVGRVLICEDGTTKTPAVFTFSADKMTVGIKSSTGTHSEEIEICGTADESLRIGFNAHYVRDALKSYDAENITMAFGGTVQPMVMSDDELLSLLLPVRLSDKNS